MASYREEEGSAFIDLGLGPHLASMALDDPLYNRQTDPGAFEISIRVQSLEGGEQVFSISHVESYSVIFKVIDRLLLIFQAAKFNNGFFPVAREFN